MSQAEAADVPAILDIEASGLGAGGYPIEIGCVMRRPLWLIALCYFLLPLSGAEVFSCNRMPAGQQVMQYQRAHDITLRRPARGPDAIGYEAVEHIAAVDQLSIWRPGPDSACISLTAFDENARECGVDGLAKREQSGEFVLVEEACPLRLSIAADRVELRAPPGSCQRGYCAPNGVIEAGTYLRK